MAAGWILKKNTDMKVIKRIVLIAIYSLLCVPAMDAAVIILTSDQQLYDLMDPDKKINMSLGYNSTFMSLREVCESAKRRGDKELTIAFDEFFRQYRPQAGTERRLTPDMDEYVKMIRFISNFAGKYDMGICLSLLSPLELGPAYKNQTNESGRWLGYKVGLMNASDGSFSVDMWQQMYWTNNKGKFQIKLKGVKAYAFREKPLKSSHLIAVDPDDIVKINDVHYEGGDTIDVDGGEYGLKNSPTDMIFPIRRLRVYGNKDEKMEGYTRVMVLLEYETPEMDYFSDKAPVFLHRLIDKYKENNVNLTSFYSDEMHIQQDWAYFSHHEGGQFNIRFLTSGFSQKYQQRYNQPFDDKYMLYFVYGAPYYQATASAVRNVQYVMGETPEAIHRTFLLRDRYYKMLNHGVVDLFKDARSYAEKIYGHEMPTSAHASWAESPTIDYWDTEKLHANAYKYEFTSNYVWGNTVHQAAAACYDYFKWGEYLQPTGNDFAETGWGDRNYYGAAMGASIGVVNRYPNAYAAAWGFPKEALHWKNRLNEAFGAQPSHPMRLMTGNVHRDIEVLILYPMSLVAVEERFGSWMTQYGYANYLTTDKFVEMGKVLEDGSVQVAEKRYRTVVAMFEPLPHAKLLEMMGRMAEKGGNVIWFSTPPLIDSDGNDCRSSWQQLFGVEYRFDQYLGEIASGKKIAFQNAFVEIGEQTILTDFLVDRIYPVIPLSADIEVVAKVEEKIVGTRMKKGNGYVYYCGFRPRDDQSASLGYESRTLFEILDAAGAYPSSGNFPVNDNPTYVSRTTDFFATTFPNGATAIVKHYRTHRENWEGGFSRNEAADAAALAANPMPSDLLDIQDLKVNGHEITYRGRLNISFRTDRNKRLIAFIGNNCTDLMLNRVHYRFAQQPVDIDYLPTGDKPNHYILRITGEGEISLPAPDGATRATLKNGKQTVKNRIEAGNLIFQVDKSMSGRWLELTYRQK